MVRIPFSPSKGLAAEPEASADVVFRGTSIGIDIPSGTRRVTFISHAANVEASTAECTVCELAIASLRLRWRMTIPRSLSNVSRNSKTLGEFVTYLMVAHVGLSVEMSSCGEVAVNDGASSV
jgi:hypothetical protein